MVMAAPGIAARVRRLGDRSDAFASSYPVRPRSEDPSPRRKRSQSAIGPGTGRQSRLSRDRIAHELRTGTRTCCLLLTGSLLPSPFLGGVQPAIASPSGPECIVLDVDVADRCRASGREAGGDLLSVGSTVSALADAGPPSDRAGSAGGARARACSSCVADPPLTLASGRGWSADMPSADPGGDRPGDVTPSGSVTAGAGRALGR